MRITSNNGHFTPENLKNRKLKTEFNVAIIYTPVRRLYRIPSLELIDTIKSSRNYEDSINMPVEL